MFLIKAHCRNILFSGLYLPGLSHVICSCWFCSVGPTANNQLTYIVKTLPLPTTIFTNHDPFIETLDLWLIIELPNIKDFIKKTEQKYLIRKSICFFFFLNWYFYWWISVHPFSHRIVRPTMDHIGFDLLGLFPSDLLCYVQPPLL